MLRAAGISPRGPGDYIDFGSLNDLLSFPFGDYPATLRQDSGPKRFRLPKIEISWGPLGLIPAALSIPPEQDNPSGHSDSDAGASIHTLL